MDDKKLIAQLRTENARMQSYIHQLERDLRNERQYRNLFSDFSVIETSAIVKFMKDWRDASRQNFSKVVRIINKQSC